MQVQRFPGAAEQGGDYEWLPIHVKSHMRKKTGVEDLVDRF
jgi:hypothetical protein